MTRPSDQRARRVLSLCCGLTVVAALTGCADPDPASSGTSTPQASRSHEGAEAGALPSAHVHAVAVNPADDRVYLATHDGLFRYDPDGPTRVGPVIDLMGFSVAGPDRFYASGHPGPGTDLPEPVGLIESLDGGATWTPRSRQGQSDFHALTATSSGVVGFDGTLRASTDGQTWTTLAPPVDPFAVAASPDGATLLITSPSGPARSTDAGRTWTSIPDAPLLQLLDWADAGTVVATTPDGTVAISTDAGATWTTKGSTGGPPQAIGAHAGADGSTRVLAVTDTAVLESVDGGATFVPLE